MAVPVIDIEKVIQEKNPTLAKWLPAPIFRYLKKTLHQEEVNQILKENEHLLGADFCTDIVERWNLKITLHGQENLPQNGGVILAANHPLGGFDALALVHKIKDYRPDIKFIVNDILLHLENLKGMFAGVNKHGSNAAASLKEVNSLFASNHAVCVFPAGLVSRKLGGRVMDLEWKKTFATQAIKNKKPVLPVYIEGSLSPFFYKLANFRRRIGIKANIEMFYLVDELFQQQNKEITITFGKPILLHNAAINKTPNEWAKHIKKEVYRLGE
jgi:putative hemolysin